MFSEKNIGQVLSETAMKYSRREAIVDGDFRITYGEMEQITDTLARELLKEGIGKGMHTGLLAKDSSRFLLYLCALWKIGAVAVPLCNSYSAADLSFALSAADISILLWDEQQETTINGVIHENQELLLKKMEPMEQLLERKKDSEAGGDVEKAALPQVDPTDPDTILFTSGTTGGTKPVLTTHFSRVNTMLAQARVLETTPEDRFCSVLPMHHCFSITATVLAALCSGACVCIPKDRHTNSILDMVEREHCTILTAVPTLFSALLRRMETETYDISSLRAGLIGGSSYSREMFERICNKMDFTLLPSLGQTEATAGFTAASLADPMEVRATTLGRFFPHIEGKISALDSDEPLSEGEIGEICIRGYSVMQGYYNNPEATEKALHEGGWLHTGDLGKMQGDLVVYCGRVKELIIRGGENISPIEIEEILLQDSRLQAVKVIGVPDAHYVEEICACVVSDGTVTQEEVREIVRGQTAYYKVPRYVLLLESLPTTRTGKIDIKNLKKIAERCIREA